MTSNWIDDDEKLALTPRALALGGMTLTRSVIAMLEDVEESRCIGWLIGALSRREGAIVAEVAAALVQRNAWPAIAPLLDACQRREVASLRRATSALAGLIAEAPADELSLPLLRRGLTVADPQVAAACVQRIAQIESEDAIFSLAKALPHADETVQCEIIDQICRRPTPAALQVLLTFLKHCRASLRRHVTLAVCQLLRHGEDIELARMALRASNHAIIIEAARTLVRLGDEETIDVLKSVHAAVPELAEASNLALAAKEEWRSTIGPMPVRRTEASSDGAKQLLLNRSTGGMR